MKIKHIPIPAKLRKRDLAWPTFAGEVWCYMSPGTARLHVRPAKIRSASASAQPDQSSQGNRWVPKNPKRLPADSEDSNQPAWMRRLIWVFAGRKCNFVGKCCAPAQIPFCWLPVRTGTIHHSMICIRKIPRKTDQVIFDVKSLIQQFYRQGRQNIAEN